MDLTPSERLSLRVDALSLRLREVSEEASRSRAEALDLQRRLEELTVAALVEGAPQSSGEVAELRDRLEGHEERAAAAEAEEARIRGILEDARREYRAQRNKERRIRWIVLE